MKVYKITEGYPSYDYALIAAHTEDEARKLYKDKNYSSLNYTPQFPCKEIKGLDYYTKNACFVVSNDTMFNK